MTYMSHWHSTFGRHICRLDIKRVNATFNNISAISWRSVLLVEETEGSPNVVLGTPRHERDSNSQL